MLLLLNTVIAATCGNDTKMPSANACNAGMQDAADPSLLLARSAFSDAILADIAQSAGGELKKVGPQKDHVIVDFRCW